MISLQNIYDEIRTVYLGDNRPWILGFSGGKDSTCMVQLIWNALAILPPEKLGKHIYIISSDTLVESPKIIQQITSTLDMMEKAAAKTHLPISTNLVRPVIEDTFWVCLLGKGYAAPSNLFRWCTERLKIRNADRFIQEKVSEYGEAIVVLGTRRDESGSRQQLMNLYEIEGSLLSRHSKFAQTYVYTPLRDFTAKDVWSYLLQKKNPWGANNRDLLALYQNANSAECPLVVDSTTPSCGNSRFGCWTCTVVEDDTSLRNTIESGEDWMEPLLELRDELKSTQDPAKRKRVRSLKRRTGQMKLIEDSRREAFNEKIKEANIQLERGADGSITDPYAKLVPGPYTLEFCQEFLAKILTAQRKIQQTGPDPNIQLIQDEEIHEIQRIWRMERGDWRNSAYQIYHNVIGEQLVPPNEDIGEFGVIEQDLLGEICSKHSIPQQLVAKLLNIEHESQGIKQHSRIYPKITKVLSEEWRDDLGAIVRDLEDRKSMMEFGDTK
ncbi:MAG: DNA phosphorothioation system sulfurtransferase DndC [Candidatus Dadabacteria bacterium]|nr:DNA phosphorothioation system sulfurtransferase DndC [Candidatus Dadabacteria bacterium]